MDKCKECGGTGWITLFSSREKCTCQDVKSSIESWNRFTESWNRFTHILGPCEYDTSDVIITKTDTGTIIARVHPRK